MRPTLIGFLIASATLLAAAEPPATDAGKTITAQFTDGDQTIVYTAKPDGKTRAQDATFTITAFANVEIVGLKDLSPVQRKAYDNLGGILAVFCEGLPILEEGGITNSEWSGLHFHTIELRQSPPSAQNKPDHGTIDLPTTRQLHFCQEASIIVLSLIIDGNRTYFGPILYDKGGEILTQRLRKKNTEYNATKLGKQRDTLAQATIAPFPDPFQSIFTSALPTPLGIDAIPDDRLLVTIAELRHNQDKPSPDRMTLVIHQTLVPRTASASPFTLDQRKEIPTGRTSVKNGILVTGTLQESSGSIRCNIHLQAATVTFTELNHELRPTVDASSMIDNEFMIEAGKWAHLGGTMSHPKSPHPYFQSHFIRIDRSPTAQPLPALPTTPEDQRFSIEIDKPASTVATWISQRITPRTITLDPKLSEVQVSIRLHDVTPDEALHTICDQEGWTLTQDASGYRIAPKSAPAKPQPNF